MSNEPTLPPLFSDSNTNPRNLPHRPFAGSRKRSRDYDPSTSSDPPLFSSDDFPIGVSSEDYHYGHLPPSDDGVNRRKKHYRGPWWAAAMNAGYPGDGSGQRKKREFKRAVDSGVWMGSEDTVVSGEEMVVGLEKEQRRGLEEGLDNSAKDDVDVKNLELSDEIDVARRSNDTWLISLQQQDSSQLAAEGIITRCLDLGIEQIDLSGLNLTTLDDTILRPLRSLTKHPEVDHIPPSQEAYGPLTPALMLYLSRNQLRAVPREIFHLDATLTVLSLRNNKLLELPSAIGRLTNLAELNVGGNKLRWLPWEILKLVGLEDGRTLRTLSIYPNPFFKPAPVETPAAPSRSAEYTDDGDDEQDDQLPSSTPSSWSPTLLHSSPRILLSITGEPLPGSPLPPSKLSFTSSTDLSLPTASPLSSAHHPSAHSTSRAPSLLDLALRATTTHFARPSPDATDLLPGALGPLLARAFDAAEINGAGGEACGVCGREYAVPRAEWIEWWDLVPPSSGRTEGEEGVRSGTDSGVPLLRRACSWGCAVSGGA